MNAYAIFLRRSSGGVESVLYVRKIEDEEAVLQPNHPGAINSMDNIVSVLGDNGKWKEVEKMVREVAQLRLLFQAPEHLDTLSTDPT